MKRNTFILILFVTFFQAEGQNLVPNYSFEDTIKCPIYAYFKGYVTSWDGGFPLYCNEFCSDPGYGNVPSNYMGYQYAHTGHAYVGIYTFLGKGNHDSNTRDYIQAPLLSTLLGGTKYYVTYYVSLADSFKYACNDIGAYFSDSALTYHPSRKVKSYLIPQVANDPIKNPLTDKINWTKVSGSFVATGGEQYIIIGNFKDDTHSDSVFVNSLAHSENVWTEAYYYIDDVIVSADSNYVDSLTGVSELKAENEKVKVWPNPGNGLFNLDIRNEELGITNTIEVYNVLGEKVYSRFLQGNSRFSVDLSSQSSGIYFYRIIDENGTLLKSDKIIIAK